MTAIPINTNLYENDNKLSVQLSPKLLTPNQIIIRLHINRKINISLLTIKIMQVNNWKQRTQQLGKKNLEAYIPTPSNKSSTRVLSNLFSGDTSGLDAFSLYHLARSCPAMPYQTTGRPEAPTTRSSRTGATFPSDY